jgi:hypothetical protein
MTAAQSANVHGLSPEPRSESESSRPEHFLQHHLTVPDPRIIPRSGRTCLEKRFGRSQIVKAGKRQQAFVAAAHTA